MKRDSAQTDPINTSAKTTIRPHYQNNFTEEISFLIVGVGSLGGTIAARAIHAGLQVFLATRDIASAQILRFSGLEVVGVGKSISVRTPQVAALSQYKPDRKFDLILLATKAREALEVASHLADLLAPQGVIVTLQNGYAPLKLADQVGAERVVGGISNLAAVKIGPGRFEQRNAGNIVLGEVRGSRLERVAAVAKLLKNAIEVNVTPNLIGILWAKLLINCSVTTLGAIAGKTPREYLKLPEGKEVFRHAYQEALAIAIANRTLPERMLVEPIPPGWPDNDPSSGAAYDHWFDEIVETYGHTKPSMLQDLERGRRTEVDFINGYLTELGRKIGLPTTINAAITDLIHRIEQGHTTSSPERLEELLLQAAAAG